MQWQRRKREPTCGPDSMGVDFFRNPEEGLGCQLGRLDLQFKQLFTQHLLDNKTVHIRRHGFIFNCKVVLSDSI